MIFGHYTIFETLIKEGIIMKHEHHANIPSSYSQCYQ